VEPGHIPPQERAGLYRSLLHDLARQGRALLVVADNAHHSDQVLPLLPASGRHRLLATSRHTLPALISAGARRVDLSTLAPEAAVALMREVLYRAEPGDLRVEAEPQAAAELARLCGYLPLALHIAAARLAMDPGQPVADLAAQLAKARSRLDCLDDGERAVRASFDLTYRRLSSEQAELLCLLSLNPGPDIGLEAAAVLADRPAEHVQAVLRELVCAHLVDHVRSRWSLHDLVRDYAAEKTRPAPRSPHTGEPRSGRKGAAAWQKSGPEKALLAGPVSAAGALRQHRL
jgi:hypothetical protein